MKILASGDIHGDTMLAEKLAEKAEKENVDLVVLCGDLTQFEQSTEGIIGPFAKKGKKVLLIPGNHETVATADFLAELKPATSYLALPTRPPAEQVEPATEKILNDAYHIFSKNLSQVDYLIEYEGNTFASTGNAIDDLLSITAVHPMREEAVTELLDRTGSGYGIVKGLINNGSLIEVEYHGKKFYARNLTQ